MRLRHSELRQKQAYKFKKNHSKCEYKKRFFLVFRPEHAIKMLSRIRPYFFSLSFTRFILIALRWDYARPS